MTISYTLKDLINITIKKWYVVLSFVIFFSIIAIPISNLSYSIAQKNYTVLVGNINGDKTQAELNLSDLIMQEPTKKENNFKILFTSAFLGFLFSIVFIFIRDYITCKNKLLLNKSRKMR